MASDDKNENSINLILQSDASFEDIDTVLIKQTKAKSFCLM
jgi:hypothetical protein